MTLLDTEGKKYNIPNKIEKRYRPLMWNIPKSKAYSSKQKDLEIDSDSVGNDKRYWEMVAKEILELNNIFTVVDEYDTRKNPRIYKVRHFTLEDIKAMGNETTSYYKALDRVGKLRDIRANGKLRTWKRDTSRYERSFKYGMYENLKLDTEGMLKTLVVVVGE